MANELQSLTEEMNKLFFHSGGLVIRLISIIYSTNTSV